VPAPDDIRLSVVIVATNERDSLARTVPALLAELRPGDELIVSDNDSADGTREEVARLAPAARVVRGPNRGFMAGVNRGAAVAGGDLLVLLNPDAVVASGWGEAIRRPLADGRGWDAWQALVTIDGGRRVNTSGGVSHFTGISWAGDVGRAVDEADLSPREVPWASGACLAIPLATWRSLGGMPEHFFLYLDDVDLAWRIRLRGGRVGIEPAARVDHDYEFVKGARKWRFLERNRWATIVRCYPAPLLAAVAPALVATELALLAVAARGGWLREKLRANAQVVRALPLLVRERRAVQAERVVPAAELARWLTPELDSPYLGALASVRPLRWALRAYWSVAVAALSSGAAPRS
jgi:GT2 family glycosyltransferase